ncbi:MAG: GNAT family N-acetyltransferase [Thermoleophilaceae bacterium]
MVDPSAHAELEELGSEGLAGVRGEWQALEARAEASPYLGFDWLHAWEQVYNPRRLALARVRSGSEVLALGLLENGPRGLVRFGGRPVTSECGLLCAPGSEASAWGAFRRLLEEVPWEGFEARGLGTEAARAVPGGWPTQRDWLAFELPESFDAYLAARSPGTRKGLKGKLRRAEREGASVRQVPDEERSAALRDFVRLHGLRAATKGERHAAIDERLALMLERMPGQSAPKLFELIVPGGGRAGVTVRLDSGDNAHFYNAGIDPEWGRLSPGILLELASIRDAIEGGLQGYDLGPGDFRYKHDLGGSLVERYEVTVTRRGRLARVLARIGRRLGRSG